MSWTDDLASPATTRRPRRTLLSTATIGVTLALGAVTLASPAHAAKGEWAAERVASPNSTSTANPTSCTKAPTYTRTKTYFGSSLSTSNRTLQQAVDSVQSKFGYTPVFRVFDPTIPPDGAWSRRSPIFGKDRILVTSFREHPRDIISGKFDAKIREHFRTAPNNTILYSYFHEPDAEIAQKKSFTPDQFKQAFRRVVDIASSLCRTNLYPTLILTGWTADKASGRHWRDFYPGDEYVSVMSWDPYNGATRVPSSYPDPAKLFDPVLKASKEIGKPWGIAETGSARTPSDSPGTGRAAWLTKVGQYFANQKASYVTYFQSTRNNDFELRDQPSIKAWKTWVSKY